MPRGEILAGSIHHVAWRTADAGSQQAWRAALSARGVEVTPVRDRRYFTSIYLPEPGGALCEIATDGPGFTVDEPVETLGQALQLPPWLGMERARIEGQLPEIE